jgi:hypothetical protein
MLVFVVVDRTGTEGRLMMNDTNLVISVLAATLFSSGCGGTVKFESGDGTTDDGSADQPFDTSVDPGVDPGTDPALDVPGDTMTDAVVDPVVDSSVDPLADPTGPECSDGIDNDGDDLVDLEDWDCADPSSPTEGPPAGSTECSVDTHCDIGYSECDRSSGTCVEPVQGGLCDPCTWRGDCGGGITDEGNPDVDWCVYGSSGSSGNCSKDCMGDFDCPKGFYCDPGDDGVPPGLCWPFVQSCWLLGEIVGAGCGGDPDCFGMSCVEGICTYRCEAEHHCPLGWSCTEGVCWPD